MARPMNPEVAERNARLIDDVKSGRMTSSNDLALRYGISVNHVNSIIYKEGLAGRDNRRKRVTMEERRPYSNLCAAIGALISQAVLDAEHGGRPIHAGAFGWNAMRWTAMKRGVYPFTILDLETIAKWMNIPVSELMRRAEQRVAACSLNTGSSAG